MVDEHLEQREKEATQVHAWMADRAAELGAGWVPITYAYTGEFREDGVLVPTDERGFATIPPYRADLAVGDFGEGFVVQLLFYAATVDRYMVVEVVWAEEPEPPAAFPIGKPPPDGTAPLRWVEEETPEGALVAWDSEDVPCPSRCRVYPEGAFEPQQGLTEDEVRERFPQLWEEDG